MYFEFFEGPRGFKQGPGGCSVSFPPSFVQIRARGTELWQRFVFARLLNLHECVFCHLFLFRVLNFSFFMEQIWLSIEPDSQTASPGPIVSVPTLGSCEFIEFSWKIHPQKIQVFFKGSCRQPQGK